ncbi:MAG: ComEC/Rec2 family competence protein [Acutalibacteraceae bacterium]|nr:ComEC/Rec2 family competence protein [Acutalibacteraceae bacterium]
MKKTKRTKYIVAAALLAAAVFITAFSNGVFGERLQKVFNPDATFDTSADFVKITDVGQADSILIYSNGYSAVIDTGTEDNTADILEDLDSAQIKSIDAVIVTHLHTDHAGALPELAKRRQIDNLIIPELDSDAEAAALVKTAKQTVTSDGGNAYTAVRGMNFEIGEFTLTVLAYYDDMQDDNNKSIIVMAEIDGVKFLFTGDAETKTEKALMEEGLNIDCDVLKVGHHGSSSSTSKEFLEKTTPEYAAISVGENNIYTHPASSVVSALEECGAQVLRTDTDGDITFYVENGKIKTKTEK